VPINILNEAQKHYLGEKMKVGIAGVYYGTPRGHSYVVKNMVSALLSEGHEAHLYTMYNFPLSKEFPVPTSQKSFEGRIIPKEDFIKWLDDVKPEYCIFMEYCQWWDEDHNKVEICNERGIKTLAFFVYEKLNWDKIDDYKKYWKIICPTAFQTKLMRKHGLSNVVHIKWGADMDEIDAIPTPPRDDNKVIFFHCAGAGGVDNRKNTDKIIRAFERIKDENTELLITHLQRKVFSHDEIIAFTKYADVLVNTSKWDSMGLNNYEANLCGRPVIVCNTDPMTELVHNNVNGFIVNGEMGTSPNVTCPSCDVDIVELAKVMSVCKNKLVLDTLKHNARKFAERNFNWKENQKDFLKLFR